jgi:hypothetical protein
MSNKRKLRRAQARDTQPRAASDKSRAAARAETSAERFAKPGSDKLWVSLLGWAAPRQGRIWLAQAVNDAARSGGDPGVARAVLALRAAEANAALDDATLGQAIDVWLASGDAFDPDDPAPKWHFLANLGQKLDLGETTPEELQADWDAWSSLALAAPWRTALLSMLGQVEQAAIGLQGVTHSERTTSIVNLTRAMWSALAYGDDASFELAKRAGDEWLAAIAGKIPGAGLPRG